MYQLQDKYEIGNKTYNYDPNTLRFHYHSFTIMSDEEFMENIFSVLHFACFVSFVKKLSHIDTLSDQGIIHELVHLGNNGTKKFTNLSIVREKFEELFGDIPDTFDIHAKYPDESGQKNRERSRV